MGIISWVVLGLIAGALAKFLMPGRDPGGIIVTIIIGIAGAIVGGIIASAVGLGTVTGINLGSIIIAILGSALLLWLYRRFKGQA